MLQLWEVENLSHRDRRNFAAHAAYYSRFMPNIASLLKQEISRLARKEVRAAMATLKSSLAKSQKQIRELKATVKRVEQRLDRIEKSISQKQSASSKAAGGNDLPVRFSPKSVRSHRKRVGLSAAEYAKLLGVSMQTVYHWEQGKSRPRRSQLKTLREARQMGKREIQRRLSAIASTSNKDDSREKAR